MMAPGFRPVGWVAAVAGSALGCYMLSLNVASERAELLRIEREIVTTKQEIRGLQTELGTRGRMAQLEQWNAEVLALSAPSTPQFLEDEVKLARFDRTEPTIEERAEVRLASAPSAPAPAPVSKIDAPVLKASAPDAAPAPRNPLLHQASLEIPASAVAKASAPAQPARPIKVASATVSLPRPVKPEAKSASRLDASLSQQIAAAARLESSRGAR